MPGSIQQRRASAQSPNRDVGAAAPLDRSGRARAGGARYKWRWKERKTARSVDHPRRSRRALEDRMRCPTANWPSCPSASTAHTRSRSTAGKRRNRSCRRRRSHLEPRYPRRRPIDSRSPLRCSRRRNTRCRRRAEDRHVGPAVAVVVPGDGHIARGAPQRDRTARAAGHTARTSCRYRAGTLAMSFRRSPS